MRRTAREVLLVLAAAVGVAIFGGVCLLRRTEELTSDGNHGRHRSQQHPADVAGPGGVEANVIIAFRQEREDEEEEEEEEDEDGEGPNPASEAKANASSPATAVSVSHVEQQEGVGPQNIKYIALIAERHSGSTWMLKLLQDYFRELDITVTATLCTWKHWFQDRIRQDIQDGNRPCRERQLCPACLDVEHTLVIAMWRNPYDWVSGMQKIPWHAQAHAGVEDLSTFMTMPWIMGPEAEELARKDALVKAQGEAPCIDNFLPWEVLPCEPLNDASIYELDPEGRAYGNVYELRKAKVRDFNAVKLWAPYYEKILYEDMLVGNGLRDWLKSLETFYGLRGKYGSVPNKGLADKMAASRGHMYYMNRDHCAPNCKMGGPAGKRAVQTLHRMWDDELEEGLGYHKRLPDSE